MNTNRINIATKVSLFIIILLTPVFIFASSPILININIDIDKKKDTLKKYQETRVYESTNNFNSLKVSYRGNIEVSDDDQSIKNISPNGFIEIKKSSFGNERMIKISSDDNGNLTKEFFEGRNKKEFDDEATEWLAESLPEIIRNTGISAYSRIKRIYNNEGISGLLDELDELSSYSYSSNWVMFYYSKHRSSTNVKYLYYKIIADKMELKDLELNFFIRNIRNISSNSTKGTLLRNILNKYELDLDLQKTFLRTTETLSYNTERGSVLRLFQSKYKIEEPIADEYFDVINNMSINSEKGNVIKPLLKNQKLDKEVMLMLFECIENFSSPSEQLAILWDIAPLVGNKEKLSRAYLSTINDVSNSYHILKDELTFSFAKKSSNEEFKQDKAILMSLLEKVDDYDSNSRKFILLKKINNVFIEDEEFVSKYFDVVDEMNNEMLRYNVMLDLLNKQTLNENSQVELYRTVRHLARGDYKHAAGAVLRSAIPQLIDNEKVVYAYFDALDVIDQNSTREEVLRMLCQKKGISNNILMNIMRSTEGIEVDIEVAAVLTEVKKVMPKDQELIFVFNTLAKDIESEYEFNQLAEIK